MDVAPFLIGEFIGSDPAEGDVLLRDRLAPLDAFEVRVDLAETHPTREGQAIEHGGGCGGWLRCAPRTAFAMLPPQSASLLRLVSCRCPGSMTQHGVYPPPSARSWRGPVQYALAEVVVVDIHEGP